jgi:hypothetical protein
MQKKPFIIIAILSVISLGLGYWYGLPKGEASDGLAKGTATREFGHIFNGADLKGWSADIPGVWSAQSGRLVGETLGVFKGAPYLAYEEETGDFELKVRAKINGSGNSGIFFRTPTGATVATPQNSYEVQIIGRERLNQVNDRFPTGSLYGFEPSMDLVKDDQWFDLHIVAVKNRIRVSINGEEVVDFTDPNPDYPRRGYIKLQTMQDTQVQFMDFQLKQLAGE